MNIFGDKKPSKYAYTSSRQDEESDVKNTFDQRVELWADKCPLDYEDRDTLRSDLKLQLAVKEEILRRQKVYRKTFDKFVQDSGLMAEIEEFARTRYESLPEANEYTKCPKCAHTSITRKFKEDQQWTKSIEYKPETPWQKFSYSDISDISLKPSTLLRSSRYHVLVAKCVCCEVEWKEKTADRYGNGQS